MVPRDGLRSDSGGDLAGGAEEFFDGLANHFGEEEGGQQQGQNRQAQQPEEDFLDSRERGREMPNNPALGNNQQEWAGQQQP